MSNKVNIKRPYFNSNEYGKVIDNSFREFTFSKTGSISDFSTRFLQELPNMSPEVLDFFISGSEEFSEETLFDFEILRLNEIATGSIESRTIPETKEHPIIPNGSFFREGDPVKKIGTKRVVRLKGRRFWYMQEGLLRYLQPGVFKELFKSITGKDPYNYKEIWAYTSEVKIDFLNSIPRGKDITVDSLGEETPETNINNN
jgi:hypothetical protein